MKMKFACIFLFISSICLGQNQINWGITSDVSTSNFGNNFPRIDKDGYGDPVVSWSDNRNMYFSRWSGLGFSNPIQLNTNGFSIAGPGWMGPDMASQGDTIFAVYKTIPEADTNSHIWCTGSFDGGITFTTPVRVDYIGDNIGRFPTVTVDDQGNPIVGFMRFDKNFGNARWVVSRSYDLGVSFSKDVLASGWSSGTSEVCDCCPSKIITDGSIVAMPYRDNDSDIRDTWVGISNDGGVSFTGGMDVDQQKWGIMECPSSGPDGVIIGDSLYTTFMSGSSGSSVVSYNVSSISAINGSIAIPLDQTTPVSLISQNFPRVDHNGGSIAFVWKQIANGVQELAIQFTENISNGINAIQEIVDSDNVGGVDVMLFDGTIWVIWEDESTGVVKYRSGTYKSYLNFETPEKESIKLVVQPNPSSDSWMISGTVHTEITEYELVSVSGKLVEQKRILPLKGNFNIELNSGSLELGIYYLKLSSSSAVGIIKLIKV